MYDTARLPTSFFLLRVMGAFVGDRLRVVQQKPGLRPARNL
jgi:hypothetical protein